MSFDGIIMGVFCSNGRGIGLDVGLVKVRRKNLSQDHGVSPPYGMFISFDAQRNEPKKGAQNLCPAGSLRSSPQTGVD
jgi:hypothetical protein